MGKSSSIGPEEAAQVVTGTIASAARGGALGFNPLVLGSGEANVHVDCATGSFVGTYRFVRSMNGGASWLGATEKGTAITFTASCSEVVDGAESGELLDIEVTAYTSGSLTYRMSR